MGMYLVCRINKSLGIVPREASDNLNLVAV